MLGWKPHGGSNPRVQPTWFILPLGEAVGVSYFQGSIWKMLLADQYGQAHNALLMPKHKKTQPNQNKEKETDPE